MTTNGQACNVTSKEFQHDYEEWSDSDYFQWRSTYCCGLLEVHGIQSMPTFDGADFGEPEFDEWETHVWAHLAYRLFNKQQFGQVFFSYVVESDCAQAWCDECSGDGGHYGYDEDTGEDDEWFECNWCDGSGRIGDSECYPVWDDLEHEGVRLGIPRAAFSYSPKFDNPNTGNVCRMMILTVTDEVRQAFRAIYNATDYSGDFSHQ